MKLYPSKSQWQNWSLPNKISYISFMFAIICVALWVISFIVQVQYGASKESQSEILKKQDKQNKKMDDIIQGQKRLREDMKRYRNPTDEEVHDELQVEFVAAQSEVKSHYELGNIAYNNVNYFEAIKHFQRALQIIKIPSIYLALGNSHYFNGQFDLALSNYKSARELYQKMNKWKMVSITLNNAGRIYRRKGSLDVALSYHQKAIEIDKKIGNLSNQAWGLSNIGNIHFIQQNFKEARQHYNEALGIDKKSDNLRGQVREYNNLGHTYFILKDSDQFNIALDYYLKALNIAEKNNFYDAISISFCNIGKFYYIKQDFNQALIYLIKSLALDKEMNNLLGQANNHIQISYVYNAIEKVDLSSEHYKEGIDIFNKLGVKPTLRELEFQE